MRKNAWLVSILLFGLLASLSFTSGGKSKEGKVKEFTRIDATAPLKAVIGRISAEPMTAEERKFVLDYYQKTKQRLLADVRGLSDAQLNYKADSTRWSIASGPEPAHRRGRAVVRTSRFWLNTPSPTGVASGGMIS